MSKEIDELLSVDFEEIESSICTQVMAKALYVIGSVVVTALAHKDTASKEDLLEAIQIVYDSVCESIALVEFTSETVVH